MSLLTQSSDFLPSGPAASGRSARGHFREDLPDQRAIFAASLVRARSTISSRLVAMASQARADCSCMARRFGRFFLAAAARSFAACARGVSSSVIWLFWIYVPYRIYCQHSVQQLMLDHILEL